MSQGTRRKTETASNTATTLEASTTAANEKTGAASMIAEVLAEMKGMRKDVTERLDKIEDSLKGVKEQIWGCERRLDEAEQRVSNTEDNGARADRLLCWPTWYRNNTVWKRTVRTLKTVRGSAGSNLRIYGVKEGTEGSENMLDFTARLLKVALKLPNDDDLGIERAHRSLAAKPTNPNISRSIVVKFLHFQTKQRILYKGWNTKELQFEGSRITLDHDYSTALQRRCKEHGEIKRQLKERNIRFRSSYPVVLRVTLDGREKSFNSAWEAEDQLKHLGITAKLSEAELMEKELHRRGWTAPLCPGGEQLTRALLRDIELLSNWLTVAEVRRWEEHQT